METIDVVNKNDEVVGQASYKEIYDKALRHRIVHVLVFNNKGEMALQLSSKEKSFCPNHWGTPAGGHVQSGETYEQAILREMEEEIGIKADVSFLRKDPFVYANYKDKGGLEKILTTFRATHNGPFNVNPKEVEKVEFFSLEQIQQMVDKGEKFHPELLFLLKKHFNIKTPPQTIVSIKKRF